MSYQHRVCHCFGVSAGLSINPGGDTVLLVARGWFISSRVYPSCVPCSTTAGILCSKRPTRAVHGHLSEPVYRSAPAGLTVELLLHG